MWRRSSVVGASAPVSAISPPRLWSAAEYPRPPAPTPMVSKPIVPRGCNRAISRRTGRLAGDGLAPCGQPQRQAGNRGRRAAGTAGGRRRPLPAPGDEDGRRPLRPVEARRPRGRVGRWAGRRGGVVLLDLRCPQLATGLAPGGPLRRGPRGACWPRGGWRAGCSAPRRRQRGGQLLPGGLRRLLRPDPGPDRRGQLAELHRPGPPGGREAAALRVLDRSAAGTPRRRGARCAGASWSTPASSSTRSGRRSGGARSWRAARRGSTAFEGPLVAFEPATAGQQAAHAEALRAYARYLELRRQRAFGATSTGLPAVVWYVLLAGRGEHRPDLPVRPARRAGPPGADDRPGRLPGPADLPRRGHGPPLPGARSVGPEAFEAVRQQMRAGPPGRRRAPGFRSRARTVRPAPRGGRRQYARPRPQPVVRGRAGDRVLLPAPPSPGAPPRPLHVTRGAVRLPSSYAQVAPAVPRARCRRAP